MPLVYVFAASNMEAQPVLILAGRKVDATQGSTGVIVEHDGDRFAVIVTGMGTGNAEVTADAVLGTTTAGGRGGSAVAEKPDAILVIGLCGGLAESLPLQRIVAYTQCLSASSNKAPSLQCSPVLTEAVLRSLQQHGIAAETTIGITSPRIATTKTDRLALAHSGASAVDMESYPILAAAARVGIPAAVLRVVSDSPDTQIPDFNSALDAKGALEGRKALWIALGSPLETYRLLTSNKRAMEHLAPAVKLVLESGCFSGVRTTMKN
jgi:nucleoside phosphorylase